MTAKRHWSQVVRRAPRAARTTSDGITFDSLSEKARWHQLQLLEQAGEIARLRRQVKLPLVIDGHPVLIRSAGYPNGRQCSYTADFAYVDPKSGRETWEEHKGHDDTASRLRRAVAEAIYQIEITLTGPASRHRPPRRAA